MRSATCAYPGQCSPHPIQRHLSLPRLPAQSSSTLGHRSGWASTTALDPAPLPERRLAVRVSTLPPTLRKGPLAPGTARRRAHPCPLRKLHPLPIRNARANSRMRHCSVGKAFEFRRRQPGAQRDPNLGQASEVRAHANRAPLAPTSSTNTVFFSLSLSSCPSTATAPLARVLCPSLGDAQHGESWCRALPTDGNERHRS